MCISIRFSMGAISGKIRPILRNDSTSQRRRIAAKRWQVIDNVDNLPRIYRIISPIDCTKTCDNIYLTDSYKHFRDISVQGVRQIVPLSNESIYKIDLRCKALEEEIAICRIRVGLNVELRQIRL